MLTRIALETAAELSEHLRHRGVVVRPEEDTPLEEMVNSSEPVKVTSQDVVEEEPKTSEEIIQALEEATVVPLDISANGHDAVVAGNVQQLADLVNRRLHLAREVVNPLINEFNDLIVEKLSNEVPQDKEIHPIELGDFYRNPLTADIFKVYPTDRLGLGPLSTMKGVQPPETNYDDYTTTGSQFIDEKLNEVKAKYGDDFVADVYNKYFTQGEDMVIPTTVLSESYIKDVDEALVAHFIARKLYDNDEIKAQQYLSDDRAYRDKLLDILARTSQIVTAGINTQFGWEKSDTLTGAADSMESIPVFKYNYDLFRKSGGTDYMILGHRKLGGYRNYKTILSQGTSLEHAYQESVETEVKDFRDERVRRIKAIILDVLPLVIDRIPDEVYDSIISLDESQLEGETRRNFVYSRAVKYVNAELNIIPEQLVQVCTDVVCVGIIPELNLRQFFTKMEGYLNPELGGASMQPQQAVYYVVLEELVDYFLSQTSLSSATGRL